MKKGRYNLFRLICCLIVFALLFPVPVNATQSMTSGFNKNYTLGSNQADNIVAVALAQVGKTKSDIGYTEAWCADFVCDCARLAGISMEIIPYNYSGSGAVTNLRSYMIEKCGAVNVSVRQKGDLIMYYCSSCARYVHTGIVLDATYSIEGNYGGKVTKVSSSYTDASGHSIAKGQVSRSYLRPNYTGASQHDHAFVSVGYDSSHPHNEYKSCSCGAKQYTGGSRSVSDCTQCKAVEATPIPAWSFLQDKQIVAMAPNRIDIATKQYISANDLCIVKDFNSGNGQCTVVYPSGGNNVFVNTQRSAAINLSAMVTYNADFAIQRLTALSGYKVYPTADWNDHGMNWALDEGDEFYTINKVGDLTEILYYADRGQHAGYWKLGWINLEYYYLDVNGTLNGNHSGSLVDYATFNMTLNGQSYGQNIGDFYQQVPKGSTYRIDNIRGVNSVYKGIASGSTEGRVEGETTTVLKFNKLYKTTIHHYFGTMKNGEGNNHEKDMLQLKETHYNAEHGQIVELDEQKLLPIPNGMRFSQIATDCVSNTRKEYALGTSFVQTADAEVEYHYVANDYRIQYNLNGGENAAANPKTYNVLYGVTLQAPTKKGYRFLGWTDEDGNTITGINQGKDCAFAKLNEYDAFYQEMEPRTIGHVTLTANWEPLPLRAIEVATMPQKTNYYVGETLNTSGLSLRQVQSDGTEATITEGFTCTPTALNTAGNQTITVSFGGKTATFSVTVKTVVEGEIHTGCVSGKPGETVQVPIIVEKNPGIIAARFSIGYDSSALTLIQVTDGGLLGEYTFGGNLLSNPYTMLWENGLDKNNKTDTGTIATLTFRISENAQPGSYPISINASASEIYDIDLINIPFSMENGAIEVSDKTPVTITPAVSLSGAATAGITVTVHGGNWVEGPNSFTVSCNNPCVAAVSYDAGATYLLLTASDGDGGKNYTVENVTAETLIAVALKGDVTGDGRINAGDAVKIKSLSLGKGTANAFQRLNMDVNNDGRINAGDAVKVKAVSLGKSSFTW